MRLLREWWRAGLPEFVIVVGCILAIAANGAWLAFLAITDPAARSFAIGAVGIAGFALPIVPLVLLRRWAARTAKRFATIGAVATALALLSLPGLVGGGIALAGAMWGILATYGGERTVSHA